MEPALGLATCRENGPKKPYFFVGRRWSGGAREHYVCEIINRKLPLTKVQQLPTSKQDHKFNYSHQLSLAKLLVIHADWSGSIFFSPLEVVMVVNHSNDLSVYPFTVDDSRFLITALCG